MGAPSPMRNARHTAVQTPANASVRAPAEGPKRPMDRGDAFAIALEIAERALRNAGDRREELFDAATEAVAEAVRKWDGVHSFRNYARRIIHWRLQDCWRRIDTLTRDQRRWKKLEQYCSFCSKFAGDFVRCPHCGKDVTQPSAREIEMWRQLTMGKNLRQIAKETGNITPATVSSHLHRLKRKLGFLSFFHFQSL